MTITSVGGLKGYVRNKMVRERGWPLTKMRESSMKALKKISIWKMVSILDLESHINQMHMDPQANPMTILLHLVTIEWDLRDMEEGEIDQVTTSISMHIVTKVSSCFINKTFELSNLENPCLWSMTSNLCNLGDNIMTIWKHMNGSNSMMNHYPKKQMALGFREIRGNDFCISFLDHICLDVEKQWWEKGIALVFSPSCIYSINTTCIITLIKQHLRLVA